jgi:hypothetical protein
LETFLGLGVFVCGQFSHLADKKKSQCYKCKAPAQALLGGKMAQSHWHIILLGKISENCHI